MSQFIARIALVVKDYDEAMEFYTRKLGFEILEDTVLSESKRWVVVSPSGNRGCALLLAKAAGADQERAIGDQTGGRVFLFLYTDDFKRDYQLMLEKGIRFIRPPVNETYGTVAVFEDLYGNLWDLIEPTESFTSYL